MSRDPSTVNERQGHNVLLMAETGLPNTIGGSNIGLSSPNSYLNTTERLGDNYYEPRGGQLTQDIVTPPRNTTTTPRSESINAAMNSYRSASSLPIRQLDYSETQQPNPSQLLRSWRHDSVGIGVARSVPIVNEVFPSAETTAVEHHHSDVGHTSAHHIDPIQSPPVAQAVVDVGTVDNRGSLTNYPVANFVTNLVRSSIDQIHATTIQAFDRLGSAGNETVPLYIRTVSDGDQPTQQQPIRSSHHNAVLSHGSEREYQQSYHGRVQDLAYPHAPQNHPDFPPVQAGDTMLTDYVLVDGELIAVAPQAPTQAEQHHLERMVRQQMMENNSVVPRNCQPKKVNRGVRRIVKLFRNKSKGKGKNSSERSVGTGGNETSTVVNDEEYSIPPLQEPLLRTPQASLDPGRQEHELLMQQIMANNTVAAAMHQSVPEVQPQRQQEQQNLQQQNKIKKGKGLWKDKSKEKIQNNDFDTLDASKNGRKARRWGGRRANKEDRKNPPSLLSSPPRSQDFTVANNTEYDELRRPAETLLRAHTGLMPPEIPSTASSPQRGYIVPPFYESFESISEVHDQDQFVDSSLPRFPHQRNNHDAPAVIPERGVLTAEARATSVTASFVGVEDITTHPWIPEGGGEFIPTSVAAESFVEATFSGEFLDDYDVTMRKKEDECSDDYNNFLQSTSMPRASEWKVDKADTADAPDVEDMLRRAIMERVTDLQVPIDHDYDDDEFVSHPSAAPKIPVPSTLMATSSASTGLKSDGDSIALSKASVSDEIVHNDILKVVMVSAPTVNKTWLARALRNAKTRSRPRTTLAVEVHEWELPCPWNTTKSGGSKVSDGSDSELDYNGTPVKCMIWDVQGATTKPNDGKANFGVHPATQSLFFSAQSLYLLVWDLACDNPATFLRKTKKVGHNDDDSDDEDEDDEYDTEFGREAANRQADRALHADIASRVLSWVDCIAEKGPMSTILPVALIAPGMGNDEVKRRCEMMQTVLEEHVQKKSRNNIPQPTILSPRSENTLCVHYKSNAGKTKEPIEGIEELQDLIAAIAHDSSHSVFSHVGAPVPYGTVLVLDCIRRFKQEHKLILLDHICYELGSLLEFEYIIGALHFLSSIGEILYFGKADDEVLSKFIVLSHTWLVSALSCILRNDLRRELTECRPFMNLQSFYDGTRFEEHELIKVLVNSTDSNVPLLSDVDAKMLWQNHNFMREASDRYSQLDESSTSSPSMFYFLEHLLVTSGVFLPLPPSSIIDIPGKVFFVPSLLVQANPTDVWTYKNSNSWSTTLCHSWLLRDGAPMHLMEHIVVKLLRDLYDFSLDFHTMPAPESLQHARTDPLRHSSMSSFLSGHSSDQIGPFRIRQIMCWKSSFLIKLSSQFVDVETGQLVDSPVEIFVAVCGQGISHCVASEDMRPGMQRMIVSGKGPVGHHGKNLWKCGYKLVLESVRSSVSNFANVDEQVICPNCLEAANPREACTFMWNSVFAAASSGSSHVHCLRGHRVDSYLLCGTRMETRPVHDTSLNVTGKHVSHIIPSVVLVGLWDPNNKAIVNVGSGFVANRKLGLIVTAGHVLFTMDKGDRFGLPYMGISGARVVIGVVSSDAVSSDESTCTFRYWAEIVAHDIHKVDACVLRIVSRMENDAYDVVGCAQQRTKLLDFQGISDQNLKALKLTKQFELDETVRILGFNQGGEGVQEKGKHINRTLCFAKGYICRKFKNQVSDDESTSSSDSSTKSGNDNHAFVPRKEIVVMCSTISGHSGGPCVNNEGKVIGILSRSDRIESSRCYLVPTSELKPLMNQARIAVEG